VSNTRLALIAAASAVFLTLCDQLFHVRTETLVYHWDPQIAGQTILVPLTFLLATVAMLDVIRRVQAVKPRSPTALGAIGSFGVVTTAYLLSGLVDPELSVAYALLLLVGWGARVVHRDERGTAIAAAVMIAIGGVLGEAALSAIGEFSYLHPDVLGVPWWLFPLYLHGALAVRDIAALALGDAEGQELRPTVAAPSA